VNVRDGTQRPLLKQLKTGAGSRIRTDDLLITNQLLYQLSYAGERRATKLKRNRQKAIEFCVKSLLSAQFLADPTGERKTRLP
jgi:hypothetical protein